jgi:hypothetical protein
MEPAPEHINAVVLILALGIILLVLLLTG